MASYQQTGAKICPKCKEERKTKKCPVCGEKTRSTGKWSVRFYIKSGEQQHLKRLSGYNTKTEAETAYMYFIRNLETEITKTMKMTFEELHQHFSKFQEGRIKESTLLTNKSCYEQYISSFLKDKDIYKADLRLIIAWQDWLNSKEARYTKEKLSYSSKNKALKYLSMLFKHACKFFNLQSNPMNNAPKFKRTEIKKQMLFWTEEEFSSFISWFSKSTITMKPDILVYKTFFSFLYLTGCRVGEALALNWNDINIEKNTVSINKSCSHATKDKKSYKITTTKCLSSDRIVIIPNSLTQALSELKKHSMTFQDFELEQFIFFGFRPLNPATCLQVFKECSKLAKVKQIRLHDLRHSHISLLINKGHNIVSIAKRVGHADIAVTLNTYAHLMPSEQEKFMNDLNIKISV